MDSFINSLMILMYIIVIPTWFSMTIESTWKVDVTAYWAITYVAVMLVSYVAFISTGIFNWAHIHIPISFVFTVFTFGYYIKKKTNQNQYECGEKSERRHNNSNIITPD